QWREALESQNELLSLQNELDVASTIQQSILPSNMPESEAFQVEGSMVPAREVGGDFYYVEELDDGKMALAVADVSDKGVPAALFMMLTRSLLKGLLREVSEPSQVIGPLNEMLVEDNTSAMFVTLFYAVYDPKTGKLDFANAGHNPPLLVHKNGKTELLPMTGGIALGVSSGWEIKEKSLELKPGESVVFYTDGVTEAVDDKDNEFGTDRLGKVPAKIGGADAVALSDAVFEAIKQFTGETPQFDDITCLTLHRRP
ncbi:MAG: PP2C family protein-serine/threonine phosphatase, partial [Pseudomonadales bacterium]